MKLTLGGRPEAAKQRFELLLKSSYHLLAWFRLQPLSRHHRASTTWLLLRTWKKRVEGKIEKQYNLTWQLIFFDGSIWKFRPRRSFWYLICRKHIKIVRLSTSILESRCSKIHGGFRSWDGPIIFESQFSNIWKIQSVGTGVLSGYSSGEAPPRLPSPKTRGRANRVSKSFQQN